MQQSCRGMITDKEENKNTSHAGHPEDNNSLYEELAKTVIMCKQ